MTKAFSPSEAIVLEHGLGASTLCDDLSGEIVDVIRELDSGHIHFQCHAAIDSDRNLLVSRDAVMERGDLVKSGNTWWVIGISMLNNTTPSRYFVSKAGREHGLVNVNA